MQKSRKVIMHTFLCQHPPKNGSIYVKEFEKLYNSVCCCAHFSLKSLFCSERWDVSDKRQLKVRKLGVNQLRKEGDRFILSKESSEEGNKI